jgi:hypothetical protein
MPRSLFERKLAGAPKSIDATQPNLILYCVLVVPLKKSSLCTSTVVKQTSVASIPIVSIFATTISRIDFIETYWSIYQNLKMGVKVGTL